MTNVIERRETSAIADIIEFVLPAVSDDDTRYFMTGVYFELEGDEVHIVATDGRRLHRGTVSLESFTAAGLEHVLQERKYTTGSIWHVEKTKTGYVLAREIEGQFPNWRRVIPTTEATEDVGEVTIPKPSRGANHHKYLPFSQAAFEIAHRTRSFFNIRFLEDMASDQRAWRIRADLSKIGTDQGAHRVETLQTAIRFDCDHLQAVIMPCVVPDGFTFPQF